jgi:hypothetical protein
LNIGDIAFRVALLFVIMDEISGLLVSGTLLLAASLFTSTQNDNNEMENDEETSFVESSITNEDSKPGESLLNARKEYDREYNRRVDGGDKVVILHQKFEENCFEKLMSLFSSFSFPARVITEENGLFPRLLVDLSSLLLSESKGDHLFHLLVSNGLLLSPLSCYEGKKNEGSQGQFVISIPIHDDKTLGKIKNIFKNVISLIEELKRTKKSNGHSEEKEGKDLKQSDRSLSSEIDIAANHSSPLPSSSAVIAPSTVGLPSFELDAGDLTNDDDASVSSNTRGGNRRKRLTASSSTVVAPDTETKRKRKTISG